MDQGLDGFATFARTLAMAARRETLPRCHNHVMEIENKFALGFDPVTEVDRNSESAMRRVIEECFPDHGISGEEFADRPSTSCLSWSLDPIDGTRSYICGLPSWTTLIALLDEGDPVVGLVDAPRLDELYCGYGNTAYSVVSGKKESIVTSGCRILAEARLSSTDPFIFQDAEADGFERLRRAVRFCRYGLDGYGYARLAAGGIDIIAESGLNPHDFNAVVPLVRAAGGAVSNWDGGADLSSGQVLAAASEPLLEEACKLLSSRRATG